MSWTLHRAGTDYEVVEGSGTRVATLLAAGEAVNEQTADYWDKVTLTHEDLEFEAKWGPTNHLSAVLLIEEPPLPLAPPPGSRTERRERLMREHPTRYTIQRAVLAGLGVAIGMLGIGALITALLARLIPAVSLSWPEWLSVSIDPPDWLRYLDPWYWLSKLPWTSISLPDLPSLPDPLGDFIAPIIIAVVVAMFAIKRNREHDDKRTDQGEREKEQRESK